MNGKRWHPVCVSEVAQLRSIRWTKSNPAPVAVVKLWLWDCFDSGYVPGVRQTADYAGCGKDRATSFLDECVDDFNTWTSENGGTPVFRGCRTKSATDPDKTRTRPGHPSSGTTDTCETDPDKTRTRPGQDPDSCANALLIDTHTNNTVSSGPDARARDLWARLHSECGSNPPGQKSIGKAGNLKAIKRLLREGCNEDQIRDLWIWRCTSNHERALLLRDQGHRWPTISRHWEEYVGFMAKGSYANSDLFESKDEEQIFSMALEISRWHRLRDGEKPMDWCKQQARERFNKGEKRGNYRG